MNKRTFVRKNKLFSIIVCIQAAFLAYLAIGLFSPRCVLDIQLENEDGNFEYIENLSDEIKKETFSSRDYDIRPGGYKVAVEYSSQKSLDNPSYSLNDSTASIYFSSEVSPSAVRMNRITLDDGHGSADGRVWIRSVLQLRDFKMKLDYGGEGKLLIKSVVLREQVVYRYVRIVVFAMACLLFDGVYAVLWANGTGPRDGKRNVGLGLVLTAVIASMPIFADFVFLGHDLDFHMQRIAAVAEELQNHQFPVRIMTGMLNGYGYVNSLFYCDIFLYLPAVLYNLMLPLRTCYQVYVMIVNLATVMIAYHVFSRMAHSRRLGIIGAAVYALSSYRLVNIYVRAAVGEYTAMCFLPLLAYGLWKVYSEENVTWREWLPLSAAMAGIACCHVLTVEMVVLFVFAFALTDLRGTMRKWRALAKAAVAAIGISAWYVVPFMDSMRSMPVDVSERLNKIQATGTYPIQLFGLFIHGSGWSVRGMQNEIPLSLGMPLVLGMAVSIYACLQRWQWKLEEKPPYRLLRKSLIFASMAIAMSLECFPYDGAEAMFGETAARMLGMVQFSWRYLSVATALLSVAAVMALAILKESCFRMHKSMIVVLTCSQLLLVGVFYWQYAHSANEWSFDSNDNRSQSMYIGNGEYLLRDTDKARLAVARCEVASGILEVDSYDKLNGKARVCCKNPGDTEAQLLLPIFHYDNYHVFDAATGREYPIKTGDNNRIQIAIESGYDGTLEVVYRAPLLWRAAEAVSAITAVFLLALVVKGVKDAKKVGMKQTL